VLGFKDQVESVGHALGWMVIVSGHLGQSRHETVGSVGLALDGSKRRWGWS